MGLLLALLTYALIMFLWFGWFLKTKYGKHPAVFMLSVIVGAAAMMLAVYIYLVIE